MKIAKTYKFEEMYNDLIRKFGHENTAVIRFGQLAEEWDNTNWNKKYLEILYRSLMNLKIS